MDAMWNSLLMSTCEPLLRATATPEPQPDMAFGDFPRVSLGETKHPNDQQSLREGWKRDRDPHTSTKTVPCPPWPRSCVNSMVSHLSELPEEEQGGDQAGSVGKAEGGVAVIASEHSGDDG